MPPKSRRDRERRYAFRLWEAFMESRDTPKQDDSDEVDEAWREKTWPAFEKTFLESDGIPENTGLVIEQTDDDQDEEDEQDDQDDDQDDVPVPTPPIKKAKQMQKKDVKSSKRGLVKKSEKSSERAEKSDGKLTARKPIKKVVNTSASTSKKRKGGGLPRIPVVARDE